MEINLTTSTPKPPKLLTTLNTVLTLSTSTLCSSKRLAVIASGYDNPIRSMSKDQVVQQVQPMLMICAKMYCGVREDRTLPELTQEATRFVYSKFSSLGLEEIREAFSMAAANYFDGVDMKAYFGTFTIAMLGDILAAFTKYRNKIVNELLDSQDKAARAEAEESAKLLKNEETRHAVCQEIVTAIQAAQDGMPFWEHWEDIPAYYSKIALESGVIAVEGEKKKMLWQEAQRLAKQQVIELSSDESRFMEAKHARDILKDMMAGKEVKSLKDSAVRIYSKLLIWEFVKPKNDNNGQEV
jgi:hypothetical protein